MKPEARSDQSPVNCPTPSQVFVTVTESNTRSGSFLGRDYFRCRLCDDQEPRH